MLKLIETIVKSDGRKEGKKNSFFQIVFILNEYEYDWQGRESKDIIKIN